MKKSVIMMGILIIIGLVLGAYFSQRLISATNTQQLTVAAAASLKEVLLEMGQEFEKINQNTKIFFNFAATGVLQVQITNGAPVDVFVSANYDYIQGLGQKGLLAADQVHLICQNTLALVARDDLQEIGTTGFSVLKDHRIRRVAIGNPEFVPAGSYGVQLLRKKGLLTKIKPKLIYAANVREALAWVELGEVDVALVYGTDAQIAKRSQRLAETKPEELAIGYYLTLLNKQQPESLAQKFGNFVTGPLGKKILKKYGFRVLEGR